MECGEDHMCQRQDCAKCNRYGYETETPRTQAMKRITMLQEQMRESKERKRVLDEKIHALEERVRELDEQVRVLTEKLDVFKQLGVFPDSENWYAPCPYCGGHDIDTSDLDDMVSMRFCQTCCQRGRLAKRKESEKARCAGG